MYDSQTKRRAELEEDPKAWSQAESEQREHERAGDRADGVLREELGAAEQGGAAHETEQAEEDGRNHFRRHYHRLVVRSAEGLEPGQMNPEQLVHTGVNEQGSVEHTSARDADDAVQEVLGEYVEGAVASGRRISGMVAVVGDAAWDTAGENHYGDRWEDRRDRINGFVDRSGRVFIHKDRGNAGTMVHEACHKYSVRNLVRISQPLNEGVTEYFARKVCEGAGIDISDRTNYQSNYECTAELVELVGEATVASAYFDGATDELREAFVQARNQSQGRSGGVLGNMESGAEWNVFVSRTRANDWQAASDLLAS